MGWSLSNLLDPTGIIVGGGMSGDSKGILGGGLNGTPPTLQYGQSPEYGQQMDLFNKLQVPYMDKQMGLYNDIFEPQMRSLGNTLGEQLKQPLSLPEDVWSGIWNQGKQKIAGEYDKLRQTGSERAAGAGMLGQGPTERYMQQLDLSQAKSMEDMAVDMAIQQWTEKKNAKQQAIGNMQQFMTGQPQFNLNMPGSTAYTQPGTPGILDQIAKIGQAAAPFAMMM